MKEIVIKVLDGSDELKGTTLRLVKKNNSKNYYCRETGLEIIDKWEELPKIEKFAKTKLKLDILLFIDSNEPNPLFINRIQITEAINPKFATNKSQLISVFKTIKNSKLAIN